jgi:hypothetical protein
MKRTLIAVAALIGFASAANAVSVTVTANQASYTVGETVTLTVTTDATATTDTAIFGQVLYNSAILGGGSATQVGLSSVGGIILWTTGVLNCGGGSCDAFNQIGGLNPLPVDQGAGFAIATLSFTAAAPGVTPVSWNTTPGPFQFDFFGLTTGVGTTVTVVPEPTTAALLGLGLFGLAVAGRRR